jgi:hypothetical protein
MKTDRRLSLAICTLLLCVVARAAPPALLHGHAHNDYEHKHPLFDALDNGFNSVEADIHLVGGELLVAHSRLETKPERTLRKLYLEPLQRFAITNHGRIHPDRAQFFLLLDYKGDRSPNDAEGIHKKVREELAAFSDILTRFDGTNIEPKAVTVVLSGSRPEAMVMAERERWWALDGVLKDLSGSSPSALFPWVSLEWGTQFKWRGRTEMPPDEESRLKEMLAQAHSQGRLLRFWGAPDRPDFWGPLRRLGVDLINTDDLAGYAAWCAAHPNLAAP